MRQRPDPAGCAAAVVGSGVYVRRWLPDARAFLRHQGARLPTRRTWLFQSGPCGPDAEVEQIAPPLAVSRLAATLGAPGVMTFGGRLERGQAMGPISRWLATGTEYAGDFRDFSRIKAWADDIAARLNASAGPTGICLPDPAPPVRGRRRSGRPGSSRRSRCG